MENHNINTLRVAATQEEMEKVILRLKQHLPESSIMHSALMAQSAYKEIFSVAGTKILYSDHSTLVVATPINCRQDTQSLSLFWDRESEDDETIAHLLSSIPNLDWNKSVSFLFTPFSLLENIGNFIAKGIIGNRRLKPIEPAKTYLYSMTSQSGIEIRLPEGFEIRRLGEKDAKHMLDHWEYGNMKPLDEYKQLIRMAPGMGVFKITDQGRNKEKQKEEETSTSGQESSINEGAPDPYNVPVAWTQLSTLNVFTNTFTLPQYRRQGLAAAVTLALAKKTIQDTGIASACITHNNEASLILHEKLGFTRQCAVGFQFYRNSQ